MVSVRHRQCRSTSVFIDVGPCLVESRVKSGRPDHGEDGRPEAGHSGARWAARNAGARWHRLRNVPPTCSRVSRPQRWSASRPLRSMSRSTSAPGCPAATSSGSPTRASRGARARPRRRSTTAASSCRRARIDVNLAPADLRKDGAAFDLPIAVGMLVRGGAWSPRTRSRARCSSASWRSTARCGRCAACCRSRRARGRAGSGASSCRPGTRARRRWSAACDVRAPRDIGQLVALLRDAPRQRPPAATAVAGAGTRRRRGGWICATCAARRSPGARSRSRPRAGTTC